MSARPMISTRMTSTPEVVPIPIIIAQIVDITLVTLSKTDKKKPFLRVEHCKNIGRWCCNFLFCKIFFFAIITKVARIT